MSTGTGCSGRRVPRSKRPSGSYLVRPLHGADNRHYTGLDNLHLVPVDTIHRYVDGQCAGEGRDVLVQLRNNVADLLSPPEF
jgi:hypothetical protein